jgi:hypothetical protein
MHELLDSLTGMMQTWLQWRTNQRLVENNLHAEQGCVTREQKITEHACRLLRDEETSFGAERR